MNRIRFIVVAVLLALCVLAGRGVPNGNSGNESRIKTFELGEDKNGFDWYVNTIKMPNGHKLICTVEDGFHKNPAHSCNWDKFNKESANG